MINRWVVYMNTEFLGRVNSISGGLQRSIGSRKELDTNTNPGLTPQ